MEEDQLTIEVWRRYCLRDNRYKKLIGGRFMWSMDLEAREAFGASLAADARAISDDELGRLLAGNWRLQLTGAWLAGMSRRRQFRPRLSAIVLGGRQSYSPKGCFFALMRFGDVEDAQVLRTYLDRFLVQLDWRSDQPWALGALMVLEQRRGLDLTSDLRVEDGLWSRWSLAPEWAVEAEPPGPMAERMRSVLESWDRFAEDSLKSLSQ